MLGKHAVAQPIASSRSVRWGKPGNHRRDPALLNKKGRLDVRCLWRPAQREPLEVPVFSTVRARCCVALARAVRNAGVSGLLSVPPFARVAVEPLGIGIIPAAYPYRPPATTDRAVPVRARPAGRDLVTNAALTQCRDPNDGLVSAALMDDPRDCLIDRCCSASGLETPTARFDAGQVAGRTGDL